MRKDLLSKLLLTIAILGITVGYTAVDWTQHPEKGPINLGLDLRGGVYFLLQAKPKPGEKLSEDKLSGLVQVLRNRIDPRGVMEIGIQRQGNKYVNVEIPGAANADRVERMLKKVALLEFVDAGTNALKVGDTVADQKVLMEGSDLSDAMVGIGDMGKPAVDFALKGAAADKFGKFTATHVGKYLAIALDKKIISCPVIQSAIFGGHGQITGNFTSQEVQDLVSMLKAGSLPVPVEIVQKRIVGPTLGRDYIIKSLIAGCVGVGLVFLFMLAYYRLPGLLANFSLIIYIAITFGIMSMFKVTLTLPGIAGFILSIGMAVDANVLIFERLREELRLGKTLKAAIDAGFTRAWTAILDSNLTTLIGAGALYALGTGPIRGFGATLFIGVCVSMFSAITVTRMFMLYVADARFAQRISLYGVKEEAAARSF